MRLFLSTVTYVMNMVIYSEDVLGLNLMSLKPHSLLAIPPRLIRERLQFLVKVVMELVQMVSLLLNPRIGIVDRRGLSNIIKGRILLIDSRFWMTLVSRR